MLSSEILWAGLRDFDVTSLPKSFSGVEASSDWSVYAPEVQGLARSRPAAVVMLFVPAVNPGLPAQLVLTRRSIAVRTHKGQIGFPGGRAEEDDLTPANTAIRELEEELGVARHRIQVHGVLPPLPSLDGRPVVTVIATGALKFEDFVAQPAEVDSVILAPWTSFRRSEDQAFEFNIFGLWRPSHLFHLPKERVWGLTAKILFDADLR